MVKGWISQFQALKCPHPNGSLAFRTTPVIRTRLPFHRESTSSFGRMLPLPKANHTLEGQQGRAVSASVWRCSAFGKCWINVF
jgi:hypothetical protein